MLLNIIATVYHDTESVVQRCSVKKDIFKNFAKVTGKHLCRRFWKTFLTEHPWAFVKTDSELPYCQYYCSLINGTKNVFVIFEIITMCRLFIYPFIKGKVSEAATTGVL